jgi:protein SCO1/2
VGERFDKIPVLVNAMTFYPTLLGAFFAGLALCLSVAPAMSQPVGTPTAAQPMAIGGPFHLVDQDSHAFTNQDLKGRPFLVFFGYTHCPDVCPTTLFEVSEILRSLGSDADRLGALFITVDPERDTPERLKEYLSSFDPHLRGLTGDLASIKDVARNYRVYFKKAAPEGGDYTMDHSALVYLMDKEGRFVAPFNIKRTPEAAATDLRKYF